MQGDNFNIVQDFFTAIRTDNQQALKIVLTNATFDVDMVEADEGMTGLGIAAKLGHKEIISILLNNKANVNAKDNKGRTALLIAVEYEKPLCVTKLLKNHADPEIANDELSTPLSSALCNNSLSMVKILLDYKSDPNKILQNGQYSGFAPLVASYWRNCYYIFATLLDYGATAPEADMETLLCEITYWGRINYLKLLWPQAFDQKTTVIINAAMHNKINILEYALTYTTNEERQTAFDTLIDGVTPLTYCFIYNYLECARLLLAYGHELFPKDNQSSQDVIACRSTNEEWHNMLEHYFGDLTRHEQMPTLAEMAANKAYQYANLLKMPIAELGLPEELQILTKQAPLRLYNQSTLKPRHIRDFLNDLFNQSPSDIANREKKSKIKV